jgi:hypothetical protein
MSVVVRSRSTESGRFGSRATRESG